MIVVVAMEVISDDIVDVISVLDGLMSAALFMDVIHIVQAAGVGDGAAHWILLAHRDAAHVVVMAVIVIMPAASVVLMLMVVIVLFLGVAVSVIMVMPTASVMLVLVLVAMVVVVSAASVVLMLVIVVVVAHRWPFSLQRCPYFCLRFEFLSSETRAALRRKLRRRWFKIARP